MIFASRMNYQRTFFIQGILKPQTLHPWFDLGFIGKSPWWFGGFKFRIFGIVPLCFFFAFCWKLLFLIFLHLVAFGLLFFFLWGVDFWFFCIFPCVFVFLHFVEACCFWIFCIWLPCVCLSFLWRVDYWIFLHFLSSRRPQKGRHVTSHHVTTSGAPERTMLDWKATNFNF